MFMKVISLSDWYNICQSTDTLKFDSKEPIRRLSLWTSLIIQSKPISFESFGRAYGSGKIILFKIVIKFDKFNNILKVTHEK